MNYRLVASCIYLQTVTATTPSLLIATTATTPHYTTTAQLTTSYYLLSLITALRLYLMVQWRQWEYEARNGMDGTQAIWTMIKLSHLVMLAFFGEATLEVRSNGRSRFSTDLIEHKPLSRLRTGEGHWPSNAMKINVSVVPMVISSLLV